MTSSFATRTSLNKLGDQCYMLRLLCLHSSSLTPFYTRCRHSPWCLTRLGPYWNLILFFLFHSSNYMSSLSHYRNFGTHPICGIPAACRLCWGESDLWDLSIQLTPGRWGAQPGLLVHGDPEVVQWDQHSPGAEGQQCQGRRWENGCTAPKAEGSYKQGGHSADHR